MSQNPPYYPVNGQPPMPSTSQATQPVPTNIAPAMQSQQPAFQQNAALPSNPMAMIAQMGLNQEQLMQLAQLIQSGAFAGGNVAPTPAQPAAPAPVPNVAPHIPTTQQAPPIQANAEDMDMDKEEGEVDEEEEAKDTATSRGFLKTPPKGPRKRSRSPMPRYGDARRSSQPRVRSPVAVSASRRSSAYGGSEAVHPAVSSNGKVPRGSHHEALSQTSSAEKREVVKNFLMEMHKAGFSYDELAKDVGHSELFKNLWADIDLPRQPTASRISTQPTTAPEPAKAPVKKVLPLKPATSHDRLAYLAKLQAAKNKKPESTPSPLQAKPAEEQKPVQEKAPAIASASSSKETQPAKRTLDKELIRQRLEALRVKNAAKVESERAEKEKERAEQEKAAKAAADAQASIAAEPVLDEPEDDDDFDEAYSPAQASTSAGPSHSTPQNFGTTPSAIQPQASAPATANNVTGLPGLSTPGLPTTQARLPSTAEQFAQLAQQHNQAPPYPTSSTQASKRPFGISRHASQDEAFVIIDSDEESEDAGKTGGTTEEMQGMRAARTNPMNAFPVLYTNSSSIQNSGPQTPATPNRYEHEQKLEKLRKELAEKQRQAAEKQRRKLAALENNTTPSVSASEAGTPAHDQGQTPKFGDASSLLESSAAFDERERASQKPIPAGAGLDSNGDQTSLPQTAEADPQSNETNTASWVSETPGLLAAPQSTTPTTNVEQRKQPTPLQPDDDDEDMEIDDDDDLDDIYEQSGPLASSAPPAVAAVDDDQEDVDSESAMDTSSDNSEESEEEYEPTDEPVEVEVAVASLPNQPSEPQQSPILTEEESSVPVEEDSYNEEEEAGVDTQIDVDAVQQPYDDHVDDELAPQLQPTEQAVADPVRTSFCCLM